MNRTYVIETHRHGEFRVTVSPSTITISDLAGYDLFYCDNDLDRFEPGESIICDPMPGEQAFLDAYEGGVATPKGLALDARAFYSMHMFEASPEWLAAGADS